MSVPIIIAEVKTKSPFGYKSTDTWENLFTEACRIGDMISIHTDSRWGGSFELLKHARKLTSKPLLAKGIHENDEMVKKALDLGADWVLVVGRIPDSHSQQCIIEPSTLEELEKIPAELRAVWNQRDLQTGGKKRDTFSKARKLRSGWLCQASYISTVDDIEEGADAVLVGTDLRKFAKSLDSIRHG